MSLMLTNYIINNRRKIFGFAPKIVCNSETGANCWCDETDVRKCKRRGGIIKY